MHAAAAIEEEIVYVRTCNKGDIKTSFLVISNTDRTDANGIISLISNSIISSGIFNWDKKK